MSFRPAAAKGADYSSIIPLFCVDLNRTGLALCLLSLGNPMRIVSLLSGDQILTIKLLPCARKASSPKKWQLCALAPRISLMAVTTEVLATLPHR